MATLAAADDPALLAVKTVVSNPRNPSRGLAAINRLVTIIDSQTGLPAAILDGNWITAVRTAGLSAVAAKYMASSDSSVVAFIGAGVQAGSHLKAFADMYPLQEVRILGRGQANIDRFCQTANELGKSAVICASGKEAITDADLIASSVTYSATLEPFLDADWLKPGAFCRNYGSRRTVGKSQSLSIQSNRYRRITARSGAAQQTGTARTGDR